MLAAEFQDYTLVTPTQRGRVDYTGVKQFVAELEDAIVHEETRGRRPVRVVINLQNINFISPEAERGLLMAKRRAGKKGDVVLANVQPHVKERLDITGFTELFKLTQLVRK